MSVYESQLLCRLTEHRIPILPKPPLAPTPPSSVFEDSFYVTVLPVLEIALQTSLASNLQRVTCLCLLSAGVKGVYHTTSGFPPALLWSNVSLVSNLQCPLLYSLFLCFCFILGCHIYGMTCHATFEGSFLYSPWL